MNKPIRGLKPFSATNLAPRGSTTSMIMSSQHQASSFKLDSSKNLSSSSSYFKFGQAKPTNTYSSFSKGGSSISMSLNKFRSAAAARVPNFGFMVPAPQAQRSLVTMMAKAEGAEADEANYYADLAMAPADAILKLSVGYKADTNPKRVNLGIGAYRDENGSPYVFPVVQRAQKIIEEKIQKRELDYEYSTITGDQTFTKGARGVLLGWDHPDVTSGRVCSSQTLSGTGALRVLGEFLAKFQKAPVYLSNPTWGNHNAIFKDCGLEVRQYRYFNKETLGLDFDGLCEDLRAAPAGAHVLLHTCAHNPTGVDPTMD